MNAAFSNTPEFLARLQLVFPLEPVPAVRLYDALVWDNWGQDPKLKDWPEETWTTWEDIPLAPLCRADRLLTYFDSSEILYFIPAYIWQFAKEAGDDLDIEFTEATEALVVHLHPWRKRDYRELSPTDAQREVLEEVYMHILRYHDSRHYIV